MKIFSGAATALVTPFRNGEIDYDSLGKLIDWQLEEGIDALVSCGTTGEASTLSFDEHVKVVEYTVNRVHGKVPVIAGSGSNNTKHAFELSKACENAGADALLIVTPYYNKCTDTGLIRHYEYIADRSDIPIIMYSVPGRTGVNISPYVVSELYTHEMIKGIKEASGNISQVVELSQYINDDFSIYSGNDDMVVPVLSMGGSGVITTSGNIIPKDMKKMVSNYISGNIETAKELQNKAKPLIDSLFSEVNPVPVKAALNMMGLIEREYRLPLCDPSNKTLYNLLTEMQRYGILKESI